MVKTHRFLCQTHRKLWSKIREIFGMQVAFTNFRFGVWKMLVFGTSIAVVLWIIQPAPEYQFALMIDSQSPLIRTSSTTKPPEILSTLFPWKRNPRISALEIDFGFDQYEQVLPNLKRLPQLKTLKLGLSSLETLRYLAKHNGIEELTISCGQFTGDDLKHISRLRLTSLCLSSDDELFGLRKTNRLDMAALKHLSPILTLKEFRLLAHNDIDLGDVDLSSKFPNIESFEVFANSLTATKPFIAPSLTELSIRCDVLVSQKIAANMRLSSLRTCKISVGQIDPSTFDFLNNHVDIRHLTV